MMDDNSTHVLERIDSPADLKRLSSRELRELAVEIRHLIKQTVSSGGGHLASNLGVVELTFALHRVFDFASDRLLWDVGHQAYVHKLLTGRRELFASNRQSGGLSGFPDPEESSYDVARVGHSSTAISTAVGIAEANRRQQKKKKTVVVIGDGALTGGMAYEGLINAGDLNSDLIVVLNDNGNFIDAPVGAMHRYLDKIRTGKLYNNVRNSLKRMFRDSPVARGSGLSRMAEQIDQATHRLVSPSFIFEDLGFRYFGPVDGHDILAVESALADLHHLNRPIILHVLTKKGGGWEPSLADPLTFHGPKGFDVETGSFHKKTGVSSRTYSDVFAGTLTRLAETDPRLVAITAAMPSGTRLSSFASQYPERMYDVGICEQHSFAFAEGLALNGMRPVLAHYSTFAQRGYDQFFQELVVQRNLGVVMTLDRAGLVGQDGATHQGLYDIAWARCMPGVVLMAPRDERTLEMMLTWACAQRDQQGENAAAAYVIRYPKETVPVHQWGLEHVAPIALGQSEHIRQGSGRLLIINYGTLLWRVWDALEALGEHAAAVSIIDARFAKPLDPAIVEAVAVHDRSVTVEDHSLQGGFGSVVLEAVADAGMQASIHRCGVDDCLIEHASREEQIAAQGLDTQSLARRFADLLDLDSDKIIPFSASG